MPIILLALTNFWGHVGLGSSVGLQLVDILVFGKAEVSNFDLHFVGHHDVFKFDVSVSHLFLFEVIQNIQKLSHEILGFVLANSSILLHKIKQKVTFHIVHHDVSQLVDCSSRWLDYLSVLPTS